GEKAREHQKAARANADREGAPLRPAETHSRYRPQAPARPTSRPRPAATPPGYRSSPAPPVSPPEPRDEPASPLAAQEGDRKAAQQVAQGRLPALEDRSRETVPPAAWRQLADRHLPIPAQAKAQPWDHHDRLVAPGEGDRVGRPCPCQGQRRIGAGSEGLGPL